MFCLPLDIKEIQSLRVLYRRVDSRNRQTAMAMPSVLATPFRGLQGSASVSDITMMNIIKAEKLNIIITRLHLCFASILTESSR